MAKRKPIVITGLVTPVEWQCAHDAMSHADPDERITLEYETPDGDLTLIVEEEIGRITIHKKGTGWPAP